MIGGSAVVVMAALGVAVGQQSAPAAQMAKSSQMTVGGTSTETTPSTVPAVGMAQPTIKGPAPLPSEEAAAK